MKNWRRTGEELTKSWWRTDEELRKNWERTDEERIKNWQRTVHHQVVTMWSPSGHRDVTKWSPSGHHCLKILYILASMLKINIYWHQCSKSIYIGINAHECNACTVHTRTDTQTCESRAVFSWGSIRNNCLAIRISFIVSSARNIFNFCKNYCLKGSVTLHVWTIWWFPINQNLNQHCVLGEMGRPIKN